MGRLLWWGNVALAFATALALLSPYVSPGRLWPVSFFGLAFPTLTLLHLGALGWWLVRGRRRVWLSAACLAASVPGINALVGFGGSPTAADGDLVLVNYNLLGGARLYDKDESAFRQNVTDLSACAFAGADVVAVEETPVWGPVREALTRSLDDAGLAHHFYAKGVGVSLHARIPLIDPKVMGDFNRSNAIVTALIAPRPGDTMRVFGVHLQSNSVRLNAGRVAKDAARNSRRAYWKLRSVASNYRGAARARAGQAAAIARAVRASRYRALVLGDLNDTPQSYAVNEVLRAGLSDSFREAGRGLGVTYPGTIPGLRIDYLLASEGLRWRDSEVLDCGFSDHRPVRAVVAL